MDINVIQANLQKKGNMKINIISLTLLTLNVCIFASYALTVVMFHKKWFWKFERTRKNFNVLVFFI